MSSADHSSGMLGTGSGAAAAVAVAPPTTVAESPSLTKLAHRASDVLLWLTAVGGAAMLAFMIFMLAGGYRPLVVMSGSMEPAIETGAVVLVQSTRPEALAVGDVVYAQRPDGIKVLHRVVDMAPYETGVMLTLKGDANEKPDAAGILAEDIMRARWTIPGLGKFTTILASPIAGFALSIIVLGPLMLRRAGAGKA